MMDILGLPLASLINMAAGAIVLFTALGLWAGKMRPAYFLAMAPGPRPLDKRAWSRLVRYAGLRLMAWAAMLALLGAALLSHPGDFSPRLSLVFCLAPGMLYFPLVQIRIYARSL